MNQSKIEVESLIENKIAPALRAAWYEYHADPSGEKASKIHAIQDWMAWAQEVADKLS